MKQIIIKSFNFIPAGSMTVYYTEELFNDWNREIDPSAEEYLNNNNANKYTVIPYKGYNYLHRNDSLTSKGDNIIYRLLVYKDWLEYSQNENWLNFLDINYNILIKYILILIKIKYKKNILENIMNY